MSRRKRILLILFGLVVVAGVALSFRTPPVQVTTAKVSRGPLKVTVEQEGKTRVRERYVVSAPVSGYAPRLDMEVGDTVAPGQSLLALHPMPSSPLDPRSRAEAEARVAGARATLKSQQARLTAAQSADTLAQREYERAKTLMEKKEISRSAFDQAEAAAHQAAAELHAAGFGVDAARQELKAAQALVALYSGDTAAPSSVPVISPVAGQVLGINHKSAGVVSAGQPLLSVGDPRSLEVEVDVLSVDAVKLRPGMAVEFNGWGGPGVLEGRVRTIEPAGFTKVSALGVEEQRVWVICDFTSPSQQWANLGDAYRVEASFILWQGQDVLQVPTSALFHAGDGWAVFVVEEGRAHRRTVKIGHQGGLESEVLAGLKVGDVVITHPDETIDDGTRVESHAE